MKRKIVSLLAISLCIIMVGVFIGLMPNAYASGGTPTPIVVTEYITPEVTPTPPSIAQQGDISLGSTPISVDDAQGNVFVRLYLKYKGSDYLENMSFFEVSPIVNEDLEKYPFRITWTSYMQGKGEQKQEPYDYNDPSVTVGPTDKYFEFHFVRKDDCLNGYYPIKFKIRYLHMSQSVGYNAVVEDEVTVYIRIMHGKDPETPTPVPSYTPAPEPTPKPQAKVILDRFIMEPEDVVGGDTFDLTLILENTHTKHTARNMRCTLSDPENMILPESGSSSFFIEEIKPGEAQQVTLRLMALPEAGIKPVRLKLEMEYDDRVTSGVKIEENFTLPIHQIIRIEYDDPYLPEQVYTDEPFDLSFNFRNTGKAAMYNTLVVLESETMRADATYYAGTVEGGTQKAFEPYVTISSDRLQFATPAGGMKGDEIDQMPLDEGEDIPGEGESIPEPDGSVGSAIHVGDFAMAVSVARPVAVSSSSSSDKMSSDSQFAPGAMVCKGNIVITYEDNLGRPFRKEIPIETSVMSFEQAYGPDQNMPMYDPETGYMIDPMTGELIDPMTGMPVQRGLAPWLIVSLIVGGVAVIVAAIIVIRVILKRKKKKFELAAESEMDDADEFGDLTDSGGTESKDETK